VTGDFYWANRKRWPACGKSRVDAGAFWEADFGAGSNGREPHRDKPAKVGPELHDIRQYMSYKITRRWGRLAMEILNEVS